MCSHAKYCDWGGVKPQSSLKQNPLNDGKVEGSQPLPRLDQKEIEPQPNHK